MGTPLGPKYILRSCMESFGTGNLYPEKRRCSGGLAEATGVFFDGSLDEVGSFQKHSCKATQDLQNCARFPAKPGLYTIPVHLL